MKKLLIATLLLPLFATAQVKHPIKKKPKEARTSAKSTKSMPVARFRDPQDIAVVAPTPVPSYKPLNDQATQGDVANNVDKQPEFIGGLNGWHSYLTKNLDASAVAEEQDSTSNAMYGSRQSVKVQFIVCEDGSLCNFEVLNRNQVSNTAAQEAIRVMKKSPVWKPALLDGMPVKCRYIQPITFQLED